MNHNKQDIALKVAIVCHSLAEGGAQKSSALLSTVLTEKGYNVYVCPLNNWVEYKYDGHLLPVNASNEISGFFKRLKRFVLFRNNLKKSKIRIVIDNRIHDNFFREFCYRFYIYRNIKRIYVIRGANFGEILINNKRLLKLVFSKSQIVGVSQGTCKALKQSFKLKSIKCIYNSAPIKKKKNVTQPVTNYILYLGRFDDKVKNHQLLLRAYRESEIYPKYKLLLVGDGNDKELIKHYIEELNLGKYVIIKPFQKEVDELISNARYLVLTSKSEGFGRVLLESLQNNTPVISVDCNYGPREIVVHEENGLLVKNNDIKALSTAIRRMAINDDLYLHCKQNIPFTLNKFKPEKISEQWNNLIKEIILS